MGRFGWHVEYLFHHVFPFIPVRSHSSKDLMCDQMCQFMRHHLVNEGILILGEEYMVELNFIELKVGLSCRFTS